MEPTTARVTAAVEVIRKRIQQIRESEGTHWRTEHQGGAN
jgi:hypothetical protein